jgi:hypothetical protein
LGPVQDENVLVYLSPLQKNGIKVGKSENKQMDTFPLLY